MVATIHFYDENVKLHVFSSSSDWWCCDEPAAAYNYNNGYADYPMMSGIEKTALWIWSESA